MRDLHRAVAKLMSPLTGSRTAPTSRSLDWLAQRGSRLEAELRVSGGIFHYSGYQNGAVYEQPKAGTGNIDLSPGAGVRVGLLFLSPPDRSAGLRRRSVVAGIVRPPDLWNGVTVGADLLGMLIFEGSDTYQQSNTDLRFGLGLHVDWTTYALDGKRFRPRLTFEFLPIPATATGPTVSREHTNAAVLSLGIVWR